MGGGRGGIESSDVKDGAPDWEFDLDGELEEDLIEGV